MTDTPPPITDTEYAIAADNLGVRYSLRFSRKKSIQRTLGQWLARDPVEQFGEYGAWRVDTGEQLAAEEWAAARAIRDGEVSMDEEIEIECFDGTRKIILNSAIPLLDENRAIRGVIIVNQDISARVRADEELRLAKSAVDAANKELRAALEREPALR